MESCPRLGGNQKDDPIPCLRLGASPVNRMSASHSLTTGGLAPQGVPPGLQSLPASSIDFRLLQAHGLLKNIPPGVLSALVEKCQRISLGSEEVLLSPGQTNHTLYLLLSGQL